MNYLFYVIIGVLYIGLIWFISTHNKLKRTFIKIEEANSGIDVALTKRYDLLTQMVDTVKGYIKHEKETLLEVVKLRKNMTIDEKMIENNKMTKNIEKINVLVENYPELKANENFKILQQSIVEVEEHLQAARRMYNSNVSIFNQMLVTFPISAVASMSGLTKQTFFEADEHKKNDVKIEF
jgi:LemA protein